MDTCAAIEIVDTTGGVTCFAFVVGLGKYGLFLARPSFAWEKDVRAAAITTVYVASAVLGQLRRSWRIFIMADCNLSFACFAFGARRRIINKLTKRDEF